MINILELREFDIGKTVIYTNGPTKEYGWISSYNENFIFVRFPNKGPTGCACHPKDLEFFKLYSDEKIRGSDWTIFKRLEHPNEVAFDLSYINNDEYLLPGISVAEIDNFIKALEQMKEPLEIPEEMKYGWPWWKFDEVKRGDWQKGGEGWYRYVDIIYSSLNYHKCEQHRTYVIQRADEKVEVSEFLDFNFFQTSEELITVVPAEKPKNWLEKILG